MDGTNYSAKNDALAWPALDPQDITASIHTALASIRVRSVCPEPVVIDLGEGQSHRASLAAVDLESDRSQARHELNDLAARLAVVDGQNPFCISTRTGIREQTVLADIGVPTLVSAMLCYIGSDVIGTRGRLLTLLEFVPRIDVAYDMISTPLFEQRESHDSGRQSGEEGSEGNQLHDEG